MSSNTMSPDLVSSMKQGSKGAKSLAAPDMTDEKLLIEIRHKFITILKAYYWEHFEEGECMPESVINLTESADRCLDEEKSALADWTYLRQLFISDWYLILISYLAQIPLIGKCFEQ